MRRLLAALLPALLCACGGGGGPPPPPPIDLFLDFAFVRADVATSRTFIVNNPLALDATVELVGTVTGVVKPRDGVLPGVALPAAPFSLPLLLDPAQVGPINEEFLIRFRSPLTGEQREVRLRIRAEVEGALLQLTTAAIDFGGVRIGESASRALTIRNGSAATPIFIEAITGLPPEFVLSGAPIPITLPAAQTLQLTLRYTPLGVESPFFAIAVSHDAGPDLIGTVQAVADTYIPRIIEDFGDVAVTADATDWLEVEVPPHAVSLSLEAIGPSGTVIATNGFEGPGGKVYENDTFTGAFLQFPDSEVFTATLPQSDDPTVQLVPGGGTYRFRFSVESGFATTLAVRAIILNRALGVVTSGRLDLNVFLAPGLGITAAGAPFDTTLQAALTEADRILSQRNLRIGSKDYYVLTSSDWNDISTLQEFGDLLLESAVASKERLNLFLVQRTLSGSVLGIAARVAGPMRRGTRASGVMVDFDFGSSATEGYVMAHELGHYLGLVHTTEANGSQDLISDTAACPANGTNTTTCLTPGNDYLMHWRVLAVDPVITPAQGQILLVHPYVDEQSGLASLAAAFAPPAGYDPLPEGWCGCPGCVSGGR